MLTRRDLTIACLSIAGTCSAFAFAGPTSGVMGFSVFDWNSVPVQKTETGEVRQFFRTPTVTLDQLEIHATTLNPGTASHPPHRHVNEEIILVDQGTVDVFGNGVWKTVGPGSVIFNASNSLHGVKNAGTTPATYHVISFVTDKTLAIEKSAPPPQ
jgi:XRE family transcriptional regulator, regulator of sulfur utilization